MAANTSISLVNLDFDTLKASLKSYLSNQSLFQDYDFDGSNISVLLDILSYNTHLNAFYLNMIASEMFIDSAQLRNSVISIAKALNYTPRSAKSSKALLNLTFAQSGLSTFEIPEGTRFTGKNSNGSYTFLTNDSLTLYPSNGVFTATDLAVYEGFIAQDSFVYNSTVEGQRFILSNESVDTDSILIAVTEDNGISPLSYIKATNLFGLNANSQSYFIQATEDTRYEIVFGDGTFGRKPKNGSIITISYRVTSGNTANKCTSFILDDNLGAYNGYGSAIIPSITTNSSSFNGAEAETIEEIRFRAPKNYQVQERAITTDDFKTLVSQNFQTIKSVNVYGGESADTPSYGKVFIAPITFTGEQLSENAKNEIESFLINRCSIGIVPTVVDPEYLYLVLDVTCKFDSSSTTMSAADVSTTIKNAIISYNDTELVDFGADFRSSKFETVVNEASTSILSNETSVMMKKIKSVPLYIPHFLNIKFRNKIVPGSIYSTEFISGGKRYQYVDYNPNANTFKIFQENNSVRIVNTSDILYLKDITTTQPTYQPAGTLNYDLGSITPSQITVLDTLNSTSEITFFAKPELQDISSSSNDVLSIDISNLTISIKTET